MNLALGNGYHKHALLRILRIDETRIWEQLLAKLTPSKHIGIDVPHCTPLMLYAFIGAIWLSYRISTASFSKQSEDTVFGNDCTVTTTDIYME